MLDWLFEISRTSPVAHAVGLLALVCAGGMALGSLKVKGVGQRTPIIIGAKSEAARVCSVLKG